jgi:hypothetical protein
MLLDEEYRTVKKGLETAKSLLNWYYHGSSFKRKLVNEYISRYQSRVESLEKRRRLLGKGMVALVREI